jgi:hypothetical protein
MINDFVKNPAVFSAFVGQATRSVAQYIVKGSVLPLRAGNQKMKKFQRLLPQ